MLRVLLIAEAANPEWTSVPLVGWSLATALRQRDDIDGHLVTHVRNRDAIVRAGLVEGRDFTAIDSDAIAGPMYRLASRLRGGSGKGWTTVTALASLSYYWFEHLLWKRFGDAIREQQYDLVHRITPLSPTIPGWELAERCERAGVPFVWGPINGGVPWPKSFDTARRQEREWLSYVRAAHKLMPGYRSLRKHASAILIASRDTWQQMPSQYHSKCTYLPENGIDPDRIPTTQRPPTSTPIRVIFVGRLVPYKGADMLIEAAAPLLREGKIRLTIAGDGPQRPDLESFAAELNVSDHVEMAGWVEHREVMRRLSESDVFAFPSIREFGGGVVIEAMAVGCVPIVVDYGGPGELITEPCGYRIPIGPREQIVAGLRERLADLADHPEKLDRLRGPGRQRVRDELTWQAKAEQVVDVYRTCRERGADRFASPAEVTSPDHTGDSHRGEVADVADSREPVTTRPRPNG